MGLPSPMNIFVNNKKQNGIDGATILHFGSKSVKVTKLR